MRFKILAVLALLALLAACAPQQTTQVPSVGFAASPQQLYDALIQTRADHQPRSRIHQLPHRGSEQLQRILRGRAGLGH